MDVWWRYRWTLRDLCLQTLRYLKPEHVALVLLMGLWLEARAEFGGAQRRDCTALATAFLAQQGMKVTPPKVMTEVPIKMAGWYQDGIVFIRSDKREDCGVYVHEMLHHYQQQTRGPARDYEEWLRREQEAVRVEMRWRGE
jgi:hypothetical protein